MNAKQKQSPNGHNKPVPPVNIPERLKPIRENYIQKVREIIRKKQQNTPKKGKWQWILVMRVRIADILIY